MQLVSEARRAWHAGAASWRGETDINSRSVGVEIVNLGHEADLPEFPPAQIEAVIALCRSIATRHGMRPERVLAHSDVAPGRKVDPGERFPVGQAGAGGRRALDGRRPKGAANMRAYARATKASPCARCRRCSRMFGYGVQITGVYDAQTKAVVEAFQRHWRRSRVDGIADASTIATLRDLIAACGVSQPAASLKEVGGHERISDHRRKSRHRPPARAAGGGDRRDDLRLRPQACGGGGACRTREALGRARQDHRTRCRATRRPSRRRRNA